MLLVFSCRSLEALPPAYLTITSPRVVIESDTVVIFPPLDAWVYPQGRYLTVVEAGSRTPIVPASQSPILLAGGVRVNGMGSSRRPYPFWEFDTISQALGIEENLTYSPVYRYLADTLLEYLLREDFESPQLSFRSPNLGEPSSVVLRRTTQTARRGFWAGEVQLPPYADFRIESTTSFEFPQNEIWAEISLRGDRLLGVGLTREDKRTGALMGREIRLLLRPPDTGWATFFVNLTPWTAEGAGLYRYRLYLASAGDSTGTHRLYLDDIRILTFRRL